MKKLLIALLCITLSVISVSMFSACGQNDYDVTIYIPDGAPALGLAYMMANHTTVAGQRVRYVVIPPASLPEHVVRRTSDMAVMPINSALNLYAHGYGLAAVLTHGNLFLVGAADGGIAPDNFEWEMLAGRSVGTIGLNLAPGSVLRYILNRKGVEGAELSQGIAPNLAQQVRAGGLKAAVFAEPEVTNLSEGLVVLADIQKAWYDLTYMEGFPQAVLMVRDDADTDFVKEFLRLKAAGEVSGWLLNNLQAVRAVVDSNMFAGAQTSIVLSADNAAARRQIEGSNIRTQTTGLREYVEEFIRRTMGESALPTNEFFI